MSLHSIVEPAGTLQTGWKLSGRDPKKADIRNPEPAEPAPEAPPASPRSKWELSDRQLREIG